MFMPLPDDETLLKLLGAVPFMPRMDSSYNPDKNWLTIPPPGANIEAVCNPEITENWVYQAKIGNTIRSVDSGIHHSQPISIIPPPWVLAAFGVQAIAHK